MIFKAVGFDIQEVTADNDWNNIAPAWRQLWERCPDATPFQSPDWVLPWWQHFGSGERLGIAIRQQDHLVGFVPLYFHTNPLTNNRELMFIGTGNSDYLDGIFDRTCTEAGRVFYDYLNQIAARWSDCHLEQLRASSCLLCSTPHIGFQTIQESDVSMVLRLPRVQTELIPALPQRMRRNIKNLLNRAMEVGSVTFETANDNWPDYLQQLFAMHTKRWEQRGQQGVLADQRTRDFIYDAAARFHKAGLLRLFSFKIGNHFAAVLLAFHCKKRSYVYLSGFDPHYQKTSPGTLVIFFGIKSAISERLNEFDFLRGAEPYKSLWGAQPRPIYRRTICSKAIAEFAH